MPISKSQAITARRTLSGQVPKIAFFPDDGSTGHTDPGTNIAWRPVDSFPHARAALYAWAAGQGNFDALYGGGPSYSIVTQIKNGITYYGVMRSSGVGNYLTRTVTADGHNWGWGDLAAAHGSQVADDAYKVIAALRLGSSDADAQRVYTVQQALDGNSHAIHAMTTNPAFHKYRALYFAGVGANTVAAWALHQVVGANFHDAARFLLDDAAYWRQQLGLPVVYDAVNLTINGQTFAVVRRTVNGADVKYLAINMEPMFYNGSDPFMGGLPWTFATASFPYLVRFEAIGPGWMTSVAAKVAQFGQAATGEVSPQPMAGAVL